MAHRTRRRVIEVLAKAMKACLPSITHWAVGRRLAVVRMPPPGMPDPPPGSVRPKAASRSPAHSSRSYRRCACSSVPNQVEIGIAPSDTLLLPA